MKTHINTTSILLRNFNISGRVGITLDAFWAEPKDDKKKEDHEAAERYLQMHVSIEYKYVIKLNFQN